MLLDKTKTLIFLFTIIFTPITFSQNYITDANIQEAVDTCLSTHPETGLCTDSEFGAISTWDVSQVTDMTELFFNKNQFNGDISSWDVSNVIDMTYMFDEANNFNQNIGLWNVSNVTSMFSMFGASDFNQDISSWDVSKVINMQNMFYKSSFNQDIGSWDVSSVTNMGSMFENSPFNQNISGWCVKNIVSEPSNFSVNSPLSESNKPVWGTCSPLFITSTGDSDYYYYPGNEMVWSEAQTYAEQYGGNLVSINSQEENDFITSKTNWKVWIGLTDSDVEGIWKWSDGSDYDFSNWKSGEPNNSGNGIPCRPFGEDYVEIDNTGYWNDTPEYHCDERKTRPFIIEIKNTPTPITDANIHEAVNTCLSTHPETGLCTDSEYGSIN